MGMQEQEQAEKILETNERALSTLARAITLSEGQFALILVRCNYEICKQQMWERLQVLTGVPLQQLVLQESSATLYTLILNAIMGASPSALIVFNLESVIGIDQVLIATNQVRDEFPKSLKFPLVLWVTDEVLHKLTRFAPDFKSWAVTSIKFELATENLVSLWQQTTQEILAKIFASDPGQFLTNEQLNLAPGCRQRQELESALRDLEIRGVNLAAAQVATWQFILGRDAFTHDEIDVALEHYQQSWQFWQQRVRRGEDREQLFSYSSTSVLSDADLPSIVGSEETEGENVGFLNPSESNQLEYAGVLLHHKGLCYCRLAQLQPNQKYRSWEQARESFSASIEIFTATQRWDWVAQLTIQLGEVLQNLQSWTDLEALALRSLTQLQSANSSAQMPQAYGFLAAVAMHQSNWEDAKVLAQTALELLDPSPSPKPQHRGWYLLILAKAERELGELEAAIANLEQALQIPGLVPNSPDQHPQLYLDILALLRSLYQEQKQYLRAFELKQQQRLIEQQYGFSTFLGAVPLRYFTRQGRRLSPLEIAAAGRLPDVNRLIERLSRNDHKLTVIHGASGVGKSSLINAGLVPALESRTLSAREVIPVVQKVYRDWINELARLLHTALLNINRQEVIIANQLSDTGESGQIEQLSALVEQLRLASENNLLTVLIFDQFEEFFFVCHEREQQCQFYRFFEQCLNLPFVKVILSLREDYLHYLLKCERHNNVNAITNNILDRDLRYPLGDLSESDAKNVISTLVAGSQFQLEPSLLERLVKDLAASSGRVRLIELQVVGAQLQAEKITTLSQYQSLGNEPKAELVERWLLTAIADCGQENEDSVWQVLFALTDEKDTRPLKTQTELVIRLLTEVENNSQELMPTGLEKYLGNRSINYSLLTIGQKTIKTSKAQQITIQIELILKILVGAGLLFKLPDQPEDRYQIVHDYLVAPIRQNYEQRSQLNIAQKLQTSERELLRVRKQRLGAIAIGTVMTMLAITAAGLGWRSEVQRRLAAELSFNDRLSAISASSEALFAANNQFDALLESLRAAKVLKQVQTSTAIEPNKSFFTLPQSAPLKVEPDTRLQVITALSQAVYAISERNRLEGHTDIISDVTFSPDGQLIASASRDNTVKIWRPNSALVATLKGHQDSVTSVSFSPDSQLIASGSWDQTVKIWGKDGTLKTTLRGHVGHIYSVTFSPNGKLIASAGEDGTIRLWTVKGKLITTWRGDQAVVQWISFNPTGDIIVSGGEDRQIKLWTTKGKLLRSLTGHNSKVNCVQFSPDGQLIASASDDRTVKIWNLNGKLLKTLHGHAKWVLRVAFSADSQLIASASADHTVKLWQRNGNLLKTFPGHSDSVTSVSFSPQTSHPIIASASYDKTIKLWDFRPHSNLILRGHQDYIRDIAFSPDNKLIATASNDQTVKIWDRHGQLLHTLKGHTERIYSVSFSPDGELIASASRDGTIRLWRPDGSLIKILKGHKDWVLSVSFSPDSQTIASASRDRTVKLWTRDGKLIKTLTGHQARVNTVNFSPDGQLLASASDDQTVKLWTIEGKLLKTLSGHSNWVLDVSFSPDSQLIVSASYDNTVKLWHRDGKLAATLKGPTDSVARARLDPTGKILATISWDNRVQLWRLDDTLIKTWEAAPDRVTSFSWSQDGKALAIATEDNIAIVVNLDLASLWQKGCNWLRDYLQNNPDLRNSDRNLCQ